MPHTSPEPSRTQSLTHSLSLSCDYRQMTTQRFPRNVVRNQKYSALSFLPVVLVEQFNQFSNLYFLIIALSQFIPALKVGAWSSGERCSRHVALSAQCAHTNICGEQATSLPTLRHWHSWSPSR